ncbi:MAG TPA: phage holin family protein [Candidatus Limnocylindria bacterium]|nr:phage holin family protein [Candidatus Limnocylindria bacterium]
MTQQPAPRESLFGLAKQLIGGSIRLARLEVQHGRQEVAEMLRETRGGAVLLAVAAALVLLALIAFVAFLILGISALTGLPDWLIALIAFVVFGIAAALVARSGLGKIRIGPPQETIASVKEDIAWAKRLLRRD